MGIKTFLEINFSYMQQSIIVKKIELNYKHLIDEEHIFSQ